MKDYKDWSAGVLQNIILGLYGTELFQILVGSQNPNKQFILWLRSLKESQLNGTVNEDPN